MPCSTLLLRPAWRRRQALRARTSSPSASRRSERESLERLAAEGLPVTPFRWVPEAHAAVLAWRDLGGGPIAVKLDADGLARKTEAGGVALDVTDEEGIHAAANAVTEAAGRGGGHRRRPARPGRRTGGARGPWRDPRRGARRRRRAPGPGGETEARAAIGRLRGARLLHGVRGRPAADLDALAALVAQVGQLLVTDPSILEIDLNPVIAAPEGALAVDALLVVRARTA